LIYGEHFCALADSLGLCKFTTAETYAILPEDLAEGLQLLGEDLTTADLLRAGERIVNLERMYNARHGFGRGQDRLPARFTTEPLPVYSYSLDPETQQVSRSAEPVQVGLVQDLDAMLDRYYQLRGWDADGLPTPETLQRLGLHSLEPGGTP
jgi:aldehyde:ferredoxin oxidoreductase